MSRRQSRGARPPSKSPARTRGIRRPWLAAIVMVGVALGYFMSQRFARPLAVSLPSHPADRMEASDAFTEGLRLGGAGHHLAGLPYFRSAVAQAPNSWTARENYANTLFNGAQEARHHLGKDEPATRSSVERMAMIAESFRQTDAAASLAPVARDRAVVTYQRGQALHTFGLAADALVEFRKAAALDPASRGIARTTGDAEARLRSGGLSE